VSDSGSIPERPLPFFNQKQASNDWFLLRKEWNGKARKGILNI